MLGALLHFRGTRRRVLCTTSPIRGPRPVRKRPGGCRPTGTYTVDWGQIDLGLKLKRDGEAVLDTRLDGESTELDLLVTRIVEAVVAACPVD